MDLLVKLRKVDLKKAGICSVCVGFLNILIHFMVIGKIIPYTWVNAGRTVSYIAAKQISLSSINLTLVNILIAMVASGLIRVKMNKTCGIILSAFLILTLPLSFLSVVQQFAGTIFEKCFMSVVATVGLCADTRIAFEKRW